MPAALVFGFYFSHMEERRPILFPLGARLGVCASSAVFGILYPYWDTRYYQLYDRTYYLCAAIYNWIYGVLLTVPFVGNPLAEAADPCLPAEDDGIGPGFGADLV